ncbi:Helix-turn-helix, AraC domain-containing protein [Emticicia oligotrophica DSM 17448]|uniref:Helix-turn-helix, AraC domain-containing protein n=1 Tax=Emticicia oligotrophica (strain DSM 17448 / CIP 109782 / MTCC 6937 / GPTSA100-15) TaxID=929562 RepID=A0ABN4APX1_EMTOG|nr:response regulator transcription factor [Emticicia oligotrophica]AFK03881.1 Helix-turn-helix, AraC domain-containing protein [Emticicia oligotrophica DSM 17448]
MKFDIYIPSERLKPYIKQLVVSENANESMYKVFPSTSLVIGFQYRGHLINIINNSEHTLATAGITGLTDSYKIFKNSAGVGTVLVYFTEVGLAYFSSLPVNELFNQSVSLENLFDKYKIQETEEKLAAANSDQQRINVVEHFLLSQLKEIENDKLIVAAVRMIYESNGNIRIRELNDKLCISQSPFEKRFRKLVGTSPKKFASIVRFNNILSKIDQTKSLTEICYEYNYFDQAHFIKDFKKFTGDTPEYFKTQT